MLTTTIRSCAALRRPRPVRQALGWWLASLMGAVVVAPLHLWWASPDAQRLPELRAPLPLQAQVRETQIFRGVSYVCLRLEETADTGGLAHIVKVDLREPGVQLYLTPVDPAARMEGMEYRLRLPGAVAAEEGLAVLVNGALFSARSRWLPLPGGWARAIETVVAEHQVNHIWPWAYLIWFEDDLTPHVEREKRPSDQALRLARWGIASQVPQLVGGQLSDHGGSEPDRRTLLGLDFERRVLYLAVFERVSYREGARILAARGATEAYHLDGGDSSTLVLGQAVLGARPGVKVGGYRPLATMLGVRAKTLD